MREIRIQVWDKEERQMTIGMPLEMLAGYLVAKYPKLGNEIFREWTGLKDKNGKEIYEGDILSDGSIVDDAGNLARFVVEYSQTAFRIGETNCNCGCRDSVLETATSSVIIGNIYENAELLSPTNNKDGV